MTYSQIYKNDSRSPKREKKSKRKHKKNKRESLSPEVVIKKYANHSDKYDATGYKCGSQITKKDICGYTDDMNPFMDPNLTQQFIWKKKKNHTKLDCHQKEAELKNVHKRMKEHERLKEERLIEQEIIQRAKEAQNFGYRKSDSSFDLEQAKIRSRIRISGGRGKPIDLLIQYINEEENNDDSVESDAILNDPTQYLFGLSKIDLNDLLIDIDDYSKNVEPGKNMQYWSDIRIIAEDELSKLSVDPHNKRNQGVAKECLEDMRQMILQGSIDEATELYKDALKVLESENHRHIDVAYYEYFCNLAKILLAKRRIEERHSKYLQRLLEKLKHSQKLSTEHGSVSKFKPLPSSQDKETKIEREEYDYNRYEPVLLSPDDLADDLIECVIYSAEDDQQKLAFMRRSYLEFGTHNIDKESELLKMISNDIEKGDADFSDQVALEESSFLWSDKYRPRKPRFLNRVNTGFDWNKYNQTHYDVDNPPPKIVQGYKFNILYPDLIDKSKTPTFELAPCPDNNEQAIITFKAGPPYQEIAFRIVNKEWETSERYGYKCQFYRDMLQVHFHFKRYRYRK